MTRSARRRPRISRNVSTSDGDIAARCPESSPERGRPGPGRAGRLHPFRMGEMRINHVEGTSRSELGQCRQQPGEQEKGIRPPAVGRIDPTRVQHLHVALSPRPRYAERRKEMTLRIRIVQQGNRRDDEEARSCSNRREPRTDEQPLPWLRRIWELGAQTEFFRIAASSVTRSADSWSRRQRRTNRAQQLVATGARDHQHAADVD